MEVITTRKVMYVKYVGEKLSKAVENRFMSGLGNIRVVRFRKNQATMVDLDFGSTLVTHPEMFIEVDENGEAINVSPVVNEADIEIPESNKDSALEETISKLSVEEDQ